MASTFLTEFQSLLNNHASTVAQWLNLAAQLNPEDFAPVVAFTERSNPATDQSLMRGIKVFAVSNLPFRDYLSLYAADSGKLVPNKPTFSSRLVLHALVEAAKASAHAAAPALFRALSAHRAYNEITNPPTSPSTLGGEIRTQLVTQFALLSDLPAPVFVSAFSYVLQKTQKPLGQFAVNFNDREFLLDVLHKLTDQSTVAALDWEPEVPFEAQPMTVLADTLAFVFREQYPYDLNGSAEKDAVGEAILRLIERCVRIWSGSYEGWDLRKEISRARPLACLRSEAFLRATLDRLRIVPGAGSQKTGYLESSVVSDYQRWVTLCGGFDEAQAANFLAGRAPNVDESVPKPLWVRDWDLAEKESRQLDLLHATPAHAYIRWFDKLRIPGAPAPQDRLPTDKVTDSALASEIAGEVLRVAFGQRLPINPELFDQRFRDEVLIPPVTGGPPPPDGDQNPSNALLPKNSIRKDKQDTPLHPDHKRAVGIMSAAMLRWFGEIAYRTAGPRIIVAGFTESQRHHLERAHDFYRTALNLITDAGDGDGRRGGVQSSKFTVGLGLLGEILDGESSALRDECVLRLRQIERGNDWSSEQSEWSIQYLDNLNRTVESILGNINSLNTADLAAGRRERELEIQKKKLGVLQAEELRDAAQDFVFAERSTLDALLTEQRIAEVRIKVAQFRAQESRYLAAARQFAKGAAGNREQAEAALLEVEKETERQLEGQITLLRTNIEKLRGQLPVLRDQIAQAGENLEHFKRTAREEHKKKQSHRALISIVKKIGSLVSIYFTGVDLVTIAETAIQAVKSAQSGDWAGAIIHAKNAADMASGGKFGKMLERGLQQAENYIGSVMADSLGEAASKIETALGIDRTEALQGAIEAVSRQAFRLGVSYLARQTNTESVVSALGIPPPDPQVIIDLRNAAENELLEGAWKAFKKKGPNVVAELSRVLGVAGAEEAVRHRFQQHIKDAQQAGEDANRVIVDFVAKVRARAPEADAVISGLKAEFLEARENLVRRYEERLEVAGPRVRAILDDLAGRALEATAPQNLPLPPVVLPAEVVVAIREFRLKVETARGKIGFLTAPGKSEQLANQLSELEDDDEFNQQLEKVVGELQEGIGDATESMADAENDLAALEQKLGETEVERYKQEFKTQAQGFRQAEAGELAKSAGELVKAAGEAVIAAEQQIQIEEFAQKVAGSQVSAQTNLVEARENELRAAETEIEIRKIALSQAENERARWEQLNSVPNPDQSRNREIARLRYLDLANNLLIQSFQMLSLYEVNFDARLNNSNGAARVNFAPTFLSPTEDNIRSGLALMKLAQTEWNLKLLENPRLLTTIRFADIRGGLSDEVQDELRPFFVEVEGNLFPALKLDGSHLRRLRNGLTFRISPFTNPHRPPPAGYPRSAPLAVYTDTVAALSDEPSVPNQQLSRAGLVVDFNAVGPWFDSNAFRMRLLGIVLRVNHNGGLPPGIPLNLYIRQEANCGIVVRDQSAPQGRRYVPVPLPPVQDFEEKGRGVQLSPGVILTRQWETRPLFGTYTVTIDDTVPFQNPALFSAEVHFVALGQPH